MEPIDYYTTLTDHTQAEIEKLSKAGKLFLIRMMGHGLKECFPEQDFEISGETIFEIACLTENRTLGLMKALCDQCQETLISK